MGDRLSGTGAPSATRLKSLLFASHGAWAEARRRAGSLAGIDEQALSERLKTTPAQEAIPGRARKGKVVWNLFSYAQNQSPRQVRGEREGE